MGLPAIIAGVGTAFSVIGGISQAGAEARSAEYQAAIDRYNAEVAGRLATDARHRGVVAEQEVQLATRGIIGMQRTVLASRNIDIGSGSALDIIGDSAMFGQMDALTIRHNFEREAIGYETQQAGFSASSEFGRMAARDIRRGGAISAFSTALGGAAQTISYMPRFQ